jgi:hypothetical protein
MIAKRNGKIFRHDHAEPLIGRNDLAQTCRDIAAGCEQFWKKRGMEDPGDYFRRFPITHQPRTA